MRPSTQTLSHPSRHQETYVRFQKKKNTVEPLREATQSHHEPLTSSEKPQKTTASHGKVIFVFQIPRLRGDRCPALATSSRVTGVWDSHVRRWHGSVSSMSVVASARASFLVARLRCSIVPIARASTAPKTATHPPRLTETCYTPIAAHKNRGHTHRGTTTVPLILPAQVVQSGWWCCCDFTGLPINMSCYNTCQRRNRALLLRSSSRLQLWPWRQPCVVAAVPLLGAGQAVVRRRRGRE